MAGSEIDLREVPVWYQTVGTILALSSGFFIGSSLVLQKKGLLDTATERVQSGNEFIYLKSRLWWFGIALVLGECANFVAYAFSPAIIVTPLGAVSVVVSAILSKVLLEEKLNFSGICGIFLCIIGSIIIIFHGPPSTATETIPEFRSNVIHPVFLVYSGICAIVVLWLIFKLEPLYGHSQPIVYLSLTSIGGAFLVNAAQGLGSSIVYSTKHWHDDNQFVYWELYALVVFSIGSAIFQIIYLNKSLHHFSTSIVTPVNYVFFSTTTLITSAVLFRGFNVTSFVNGATIILGFSVIVIGVALLFQYNLKLNKLAKARAVKDAQDTENMSGLEEEIFTEENLDEPHTDQDPISLWVQTFPFRQPLQRRNSLPQPLFAGPPDPIKNIPNLSNKREMHQKQNVSSLTVIFEPPSKSPTIRTQSTDTSCQITCESKKSVAEADTENLGLYSLRNIENGDISSVKLQ